MIQGIGFSHKKFNFPVGEMHIKLEKYRPNSRVSLHFIFEKNEDIIELLLVCDALRRNGLYLEGINMPYVPFSRQDRLCNPGESFSLSVFTELINNIQADVVEITDPHSDVVSALINNCSIKSQDEVFKPILSNYEHHILVSPDGGSLKKIYKCVTNKCIRVVEASKIRDVKTGNITHTEVYWGDFTNKTCVIVDDICDGGRTFVELGKVLKEKNASKIVLMVTHGFFTKGIEVFDGLIDEIYTMEGKIK